jgi:hypothetical protein
LEEQVPVVGLRSDRFRHLFDEATKVDSRLAKTSHAEIQPAGIQKIFYETRQSSELSLDDLARTLASFRAGCRPENLQRGQTRIQRLAHLVGDDC